MQVARNHLLLAALQLGQSLRLLCDRLGRCFRLVLFLFGILFELAADSGAALQQSGFGLDEQLGTELWVSFLLGQLASSNKCPHFLKLHQLFKSAQAPLGDEWGGAFSFEEGCAEESAVTGNASAARDSTPRARARIGSGSRQHRFRARHAAIPAR